MSMSRLVASPIEAFTVWPSPSRFMAFLHVLVRRPAVASRSIIKAIILNTIKVDRRGDGTWWINIYAATESSLRSTVDRLQLTGPQGWPFVQQPSKAQYHSTLHLDSSFTIMLTPPVQDIFACRTLWHPFHLVYLITQLPRRKSCPLYPASIWCRSIFIFLRLLFRSSLLDLYNVIGVYCSKSCHISERLVGLLTTFRIHRW